MARTDGGVARLSRCQGLQPMSVSAVALWHISHGTFGLSCGTSQADSLPPGPRLPQPLSAGIIGGLAIEAHPEGGTVIWLFGQ